MAKTDAHYWLAIKAIPRLALAKKLALYENIGAKRLFESPPALSAYNLTAKQLAAITHPDWSKIERIIVACQQCACRIITFDSALYPPLLKEIYDPPLVLYVQGDSNILSRSQIALVGSRSATINGRENCKAMAYQLSNNHLIVTSGLAIGIDGSAHRGALNAQKPTIAVVATGLDIVYPARHRQLAHEIISTGGAIVSEFPPGTLAKPGHFPKRNRIISGLAKGVLVVEAEMKSGSLITARTALEQDREVFAMPGVIGNPYAKGCHWLIKQGAKLVDDAADIINELDFPEKVGFTLQEGKKIGNNDKQSLFIDPLLASVGDETTPVDLVVSRSKLPIAEVLSRLTILELKGQVVAVPGGYQKINKG